MILYDLRLALLSMRRNPALTALMATAIAFGIAACTTMIAIYHFASINPIWWKSDQLYAVTLDLKSTDTRMRDLLFDRHWEDPPAQLAYRDAVALLESKIPAHKVMMYRAARTLDPGKPGVKAFNTFVRLTTADFFTMFDVPFRYGSGWSAAADDGPDASVVLSKRINDRVFGGENSVGRTISLNGRDYRVVGVLDEWMPQIKFYDLNLGASVAPEDIYLPLRWGETLALMPMGGFSCMDAKAVPGMSLKGFEGLKTTDCVWLQFWAELPDHAHVLKFQQFIDSYVTDQKASGRFPRPLNNHLYDVEHWLKFNDVVGADNRILLVLAFMFLGICLLNTVGLMLAKFLGLAPVAGLRRALGASRADILRQHLTEVIVIGLLGGLGGLGLATWGLAIRGAFLARTANNVALIPMVHVQSGVDGTVLMLAFGLSLLAAVLAGLYPAWRICRSSPASHLKTQ